MRTLDEMQDTEARELFARARIDEREGFRADLRSRLLAQVAQAATERRSNPWWALRIPRPVLAGVAVVALLFGTTGSAAAGSLPGEPLFEVKRAAEELALTLAFDDATRLERLAAQASARLAELERAADGPGKSAAARESTRALERLAEAQRGTAAEPGSRASQTAETARDHAESVLKDLETKLPAEAAEGIRRAIEAGRPEQPGRRSDPSVAPSARPTDVPRVSPPGRSSDAPGGAPSPRPTPPDRGRSAP